MMRHRAVAVAALRSLGFARDDIKAIELAMVLFALQACNHLVNKVVNVKQFQFYAGVVDGVRQVVGKGIAEGGHGTVIVGAAPLAKEVREAVHQDFGARLAAILQEQVFACLLASAILAVAKAAGETGLLAAAEHHWASVVVLTERIQQGAGKAKVALHKLFLVLRTVHTRQIEHKVGITAPLVQLLGCGIQVVLKDSVNLQLRESPVLAIGNILQRPTEVLSYEPLGTSYENLHIIRDWEFRSVRFEYRLKKQSSLLSLPNSSAWYC